MFLVDQIILVGSILLILGILSSKFSARLGLPVLVLFLVVGMLAGSEGLGGIAFENHALAHGIGSVALALILFDGGLRTQWSAFRAAWKPSLALATLGVLITSLVTGVAAAHVLGISLLEGMLLGSIIGSTDAAAVFALLRSAGVRLKERLSSTLEIESGSNDPMAIFLTIGLLEVLLGRMPLGTGLVWLFVQQMGVGAAAGLLIGRGAVSVVNRINIESAGLYPLLTGACGMLAFGAAASLGGSGFLAVYLAGIVLGNNRLVFKRGTLLFHDGLAWAGQIVMFTVLGLLSFPSQLIEVAAPGLLVSLVLVFVARPLAVYPILLPFRFSFREMTLVAWGGLKGAVPIILATFPLMFGLPSGPLLFNVVFFAVLISATTQGWSLPLLARWLGLQQTPEPDPPVSLEITSLRDVNADIVDYTVAPESRAAGRLIRELALPDSVVVAMISRAGELIPPRGTTRVEAGDHLFIVMRPELRTLVNRVFSREAPEPLPTLIEFPLMASMTAAELSEFYGIQLDADGDLTLAEVITARLGDTLGPGSVLTVDGVTLRVRDMVDNEVVTVGLVIPEVDF